MHTRIYIFKEVEEGEEEAELLYLINDPKLLYLLNDPTLAADLHTHIYILKEVEEGEKEAELLYLINDPTLAAGPKAVLKDLREERLLHHTMPGMRMLTYADVC